MVPTQATSVESGSLSSVKPGSAALNSPALNSIVKKLLTGISGLVLALFVIFHLLGNLTLFFSASAYNQLAYRIESFGPLTWLVELGLGAIALTHIAIGINIYWGKREARSTDYAVYASAGEPSRQTLSSRTMVFSGLALGIFLVVHLATFKFGKVYLISDSTHRDLSRLVFETFHKPAYTFGYVAVLSLVGLHLRHGLWSALQSLGIATKPALYAASAVLGGAIALGFIGLPLAIYFNFIG
jgi:succinate dehydrogenase / fumarate reductase, cytochrome b subunit